MVCAAMIRSLISFDQCWTVPGDRGRADLSLLSGIQAADMNAHNVVTQTLDRILTYYVPFGSQSLPGSPDSWETDSTLDRLEFQWLNNTGGLARPPASKRPYAAVESFSHPNRTPAASDLKKVKHTGVASPRSNTGNFSPSATPVLPSSAAESSDPGRRGGYGSRKRGPGGEVEAAEAVA